MDCRSVERLADIDIKFTKVVPYNGISKVLSIGKDGETCLEDHNCTL